MADYDKRLKITCILSVILGLGAGALGVIELLFGTVMAANNDAIKAALMKSTIIMYETISTEIAEYVMIATGILFIVLALALFYTAFLSVRREHYSVGIIILFVVLIALLIPAVFGSTVFLIPACAAGIALWLFGSSQYEFY